MSARESPKHRWQFGNLRVEHVFAVMEHNQKDDKQLGAGGPQVLVSIVGDSKKLTEDVRFNKNLVEGAKLLSLCWDSKLKVEVMVDASMDKHLAHAKECGIPWMVLVDVDNDIEEGMIEVKNLKAGRDHGVDASTFPDELMILMKTPDSSRYPKKLST